MADTTFPTAIDAFLPVEETHLQIPRMQAAIVAIETKIGIGAKVGTDISATGDVVIGGGTSYEIGALAGNIVLTFKTTGATEGDVITLVRTGTTAHTVQCDNGGAGAGTMITLPASVAATAQFEYINANWRLLDSTVGNKNVYGATGDTKIVGKATGSTLTLANSLEMAGDFAVKMTASAATDITLPTAGTLATQANITGKKGTIELKPAEFFDAADGTALAKYAADDAGTVGLWSDGSKAAGLRWNNTGAATKTVATTFAVPADCDVSVVPTVKIRCAKTGATALDIPVLVVGMYAQTDGALYDAGANLGASTGALANPAAKTVQLASAALSAFPGLTSHMTLTLNPTAAQLATDDLIVFGVTIEYTKALG